MIPVLPLMVLVQVAPLPGPLEIQPGLFVLPGSPVPSTFAQMKALGITHIINLRMPGEGDFRTEAATARSQGEIYLSCPVAPGDLPTGLDKFRDLMSALPATARVLVHCATGNRAGGALFAFWALDKGMPEEEAMALAKRAGLRNSATETAVKGYVAARRLGPDQPRLTPATPD